MIHDVKTKQTHKENYCVPKHAHTKYCRFVDVQTFSRNMSFIITARLVHSRLLCVLACTHIDLWLGRFGLHLHTEPPGCSWPRIVQLDTLSQRHTHTPIASLNQPFIHSVCFEAGSQVLQRGPMNPAGHSQAPVEGTHLPPFSHWHSRSQLGPYRPSSQTEITVTQFSHSIIHLFLVAFKYDLQPVKSYLGHICGRGNLVHSNMIQTPGGRAGSSLNTGRPGYSFSRMFLGYKLTERCNVLEMRSALHCMHQ